MITALGIGLVLVFFLGLALSADHNTNWSPAAMASLLCLSAPLGLSIFLVAWHVTHSVR